MTHPTPRLTSEDMWCFGRLVARNEDLPSPTVATALKDLDRGLVRVHYSLIVADTIEVERWAEAMGVAAGLASELDGWMATADGFLDCHHDDRDGYDHPLRVSVTSSIRAFVVGGAA